MARFFILLLIALLPLRGWTAERMVFQMDSGAATVSQSLERAMPTDCALHMQTASANHPASEASSHGPTHKGCQSCQLCMPLLALAPIGMPALVSIPQALPHTRASRYSSADAASCVKPPIS